MDIQLIETIKCLDGELSNLHWHNIRFNRARKEYLGLHTKINLANFVKVPSSFKKGLYRCRVTYSKAIDNIEYFPHEFREVNRLKLIEEDKIDYRYKYADRQKLNWLYEQRQNCDDILIVKNGCISDSLTANTLFFDGKHWWTPDTPLLEGTQRAHLISEKKIDVCRITPQNLSNYQKVGLINAMWNFENMPVIDVDQIKR